jgi:hypothetical protein
MFLSSKPLNVAAFILVGWSCGAAGESRRKENNTSDTKLVFIT